MHGGDAVHPVKGTLVHELCRSDSIQGQYFCNFETNPEYVARWEAAGLRVAARGPRNEMRAFDLPGQNFFLATLFQPQLSSRPVRKRQAGKRWWPSIISKARPSINRVRLMPAPPWQGKGRRCRRLRPT